MIPRRGFLSQLATLAAALGCRATSLAPTSSPVATRDPLRSTPAPTRPPRPSGPERWDPSRTWVLVAGLLRWQHPDVWPGFEEDERRDVALAQAFERRGVPRSQVVTLLDEAATRAALEASLASILSRSQPGDTLWFFFGGHGAVEDGVGYFAPFDADDSLDETGWPMTSVVRSIARDFKGARVFLASDCCHSGVLVREAAALTGSHAWAAFGSALPTESSTDTWTFTNCMIDAISGAPAMDLDRDGAVSVSDAGAFNEVEMAFAEAQLASWNRSPDMPADFKLSSVSSPIDPRTSARFEALWQGDWYPVRVLGRSGDRVRVRYLRADDGATAPDEEELPRDSVRAWQPIDLPAGTAVRAESEGHWYNATVLEARLGIHHVRFDRHRDEDTWVGPSSIRRR